MGEILSGIPTVIAAFFSGDSWEIRQALRQPAAWPVGLIAVLLGGYIVMLIYKYVPFIERNLEKYIMVVSYLAIGGIIFVEVIRRFVFSVQAPWSTTLPPFLFLVMTWVGCAYNVKLRTHLAFAEFRTNMPRPAQMACLTLDAVLWLGFSWVVIVTSSFMVANSASNFQILLGTDNVLQWWFLMSVPLSFTLLAGRVLQNWFDDVKTYRTDEPLIKAATIGEG